jgi:hypothetical protein
MKGKHQPCPPEWMAEESVGSWRDTFVLEHELRLVSHPTYLLWTDLKPDPNVEIVMAQSVSRGHSSQRR